MSLINFRIFRFSNLLIIIILSVFIFNSCYYDKAETLYQYETSSNCDLSNVTYSSTITGILSSNCYQCHSHATASLSGGIILDDYTDVVSNINKVWGSINGLSGYPTMPPGGGQISPCDISQIQVWMKSNTPNN